jgi:Ser/Thr protein kinase RdoA (MazF antagonist)
LLSVSTQARRVTSSSISSDTFPVVYSTLACSAIVANILPNYAIGLVRSCQFWHRGLSDIYILEGLEQQYILRISHAHWRSKSDIDFELELLDFLRQRQIPVAYPLKTHSGALSVEINAPEGKRYASLFIYAPGQVAVGDLSEIQAHLLGEVVAKLHRATHDFRCTSDRQPLDLAYLLDHSFHNISPFLRHRPQDNMALAKTIANIKHQLRDLPQASPFWVVCWGDPHSGNVHFTLDNRLTLFDFDQCGQGWRAFEIAKFLQVAICGGLKKRVREAFIQGYQAIQPLTAYELDSLQALTQTAYIWAWFISLSHSMLHDYSRLDDSYFKQRLEQFKRLSSSDWQLF